MFLLKEDKKIKKFFLLLVSAAGVIFLYPFLNFQPSLAQGDHGANLYAFQETLRGKIPYKDFWYPYGPLMLYYYSFFLKILGENIQSVLIGFCFLKFLAGIFCYLTLSLFIYPFLAFIGSLWFFAFCPDFFITYNHNAVFTLSLICLYCLFSYLKNARGINVFLGLMCLFLILFIRVNMGFFLIPAFLTCILWIDHVNKTSFLQFNKLLSRALFICLLSVSLLLIYLFSSRFPSYSLNQYLNYFNNSNSPAIFLYRIKLYLWNIVSQNLSPWPILIFSILALGAAARTIFILFSKKCGKNIKNIIVLTIGSSLIFLFLSFHEYLASELIYRMLWTAPFETILVFLCIGFGTRGFRPLILLLIYFTILLIPFTKVFAQHDAIARLKDPQHYLHLKKGSIYTGNPAGWTTTVTETVTYLENHLKNNELFLALPYEPLYYFLTGRESPLWRLLLIQAASPNKEEEKDIIQTLEEKKVNYIVLSNRAYSKERDIGGLGETYLIDLYQYIVKNYEEVETFGNWNAPAGWIANHATKILRRK